MAEAFSVWSLSLCSLQGLGKERHGRQPLRLQHWPIHCSSYPFSSWVSKAFALLSLQEGSVIFYFAVLLKHVGCLLAKRSEVVRERTGLISSIRLRGLQPGSTLYLLCDFGRVPQRHSASVSFCKMESTVLPPSLVAVRICESIYLPSVTYLSIIYLSLSHTHTHTYKALAHSKII